MDDHQIQLEEKDEVINDLNRMVADQDLTIKQMEHTRDSNMHKLRNASEENQVSYRVVLVFVYNKDVTQDRNTILSINTHRNHDEK